MIAATPTEIDRVYEAIKLALTACDDATITAALADALLIVQRRKETRIVATKISKHEWKACVIDRPIFASYGRSFGEAVGWLHSRYALAQLDEEWPGLPLELREDWQADPEYKGDWPGCSD